MIRTSVKLVAAVWAAAVLMTGCGSTMTNNNGAAASSAAASKKLESLPSLGDTEKQLRSTIEEIGRAVTAIVPSAKWKWEGEGNWAGCPAPFDNTKGAVVNIPDYVATNVNIPEDKWQHIVQQARLIAARGGAPGMQIMANSPGHHDVWFFNDNDGTRIMFGTQANIVISGRTGCRLPSGWTPPGG